MGGFIFIADVAHKGGNIYLETHRYNYSCAWFLISGFLSNIQNSFAKNYNLINDRNGSLFEHNFKAKRIMNNEEFIHVSRYIHLNHVTSRIIEFDQLLTYEWTSLPCYLNENLNKFVNTQPISDWEALYD